MSTTDNGPICDVCGKRIPMRVGRFRPGDVSIHVECYERWRKEHPTDWVKEYGPEKCPFCGKPFVWPEASYEDRTIFRVLPGERLGVRVHLLCSAKERTESERRDQPRA